MLLQDFRNKVRVDLSDQAKEYIGDDILDRALDRAVSDLSRFLPLSKVLEITFDVTVTNEAWISDATAGVYVALKFKPIKYQSETVKNNAGDTMTRDTDYTIKYHEGKMTQIDAGSIGETESCTVSYVKSTLAIDLTSIASELVRVERLEYPYGNVPQDFVSFDLTGNYLTITGVGIGNQATVSDKTHAVVYYKSLHTPPIGQASGTFPEFLDETILLASDAYTLFSLAMMHEHQAVSYLTTAKTEYLDSIAAIHILVDTALDRIVTYSDAGILEITDGTASMTVSLASAATALGNMGGGVSKAEDALDKVTTYCETNTDGNAKLQLENIKTDLANLRTKVYSELDDANALADAVATDLGDSGANGVWTELVKHILTDALPNAQTYLEAGDDYIDLANYSIGASSIADRIAAALDGLAAQATASGEYIKHETNDDSEKYVALAAGCVSDIDTALSDMHGLLKVDGVDDGDAHWWLIQGTDTINEVNKGGKQVPVIYKEYCDATRNLAMALEAEAGARTNKATLYYRLAELYKEYAVASQNVSTAWGMSTNSLVEYMKALSQQALTYKDYAETTLNMAKLWGDKRDAYILQAGRRNDAALAEVYVVAQRIAALNAYIAESTGWNDISRTFIAEAELRLSTGAHYGEQARGHLEAANTHSRAAETYARLSEASASEANSRIYEIDRLMGQADHLVELAKGRRETADRMRADAIERRNEAWTIWRDPSGLGFPSDSKAVRQHS